MKRDPRLRALSSDHHHALALARRLLGLCAERRVGADDVAELRARFEAELAPHFALEETVLLPALRDAGEAALVERTLREHALLREHLAAAEGGELTRVETFANALTEHVRFEERELFPACEERLVPEVLDRVAREAAERPR